MGKQLLRVATMGTACVLIAAASAFAEPHVVRVGNLFLKDSGGIFPSRLPRHTQVPIAAHINAELGTTDGSHPPAVKTLSFDIDKTIQVNAKGLPACKYGQLTNRTTVPAMHACPHAIVGAGNGDVEVEFPDSKPFTANGPFILFNGGVQDGTTHLLVYTYVHVPAPTTVVVPVTLTRIHRGHFGLHTFTKVPAIAGGFGSITKVKLRIYRTFAYKGKNESYLTASCPTGHYFTQGRVLFSDGTTLGLTHVLPCTPKK